MKFSRGFFKNNLEGALKKLIEESDFDGIVDLFERISSQATDEETLTQHLNRAKCFKYFHSKKFDELYKLVDAFTFERAHHSELQVLFSKIFEWSNDISRNCGMKQGIKTSKFDWIKKEKRKNFLIVPLDPLINIVFVKSKFFHSHFDVFTNFLEGICCQRQFGTVCRSKKGIASRHVI